VFKRPAFTVSQPRPPPHIDRRYSIDVRPFRILGRDGAVTRTLLKVSLSGNTGTVRSFPNNPESIERQVTDNPV
jgi:hypothetical protein